MRKQANILDWPRPDLDPQIFNAGSVLKPEVKTFILDFISSFAQANNFKDVYSWMDDIKLVGSLTTNCYNSNSDMDIHIVVDLPKFVEIEHPEMSEQEASDYLDAIRKQVDQVKAKVPGTEHPTEIYFENKFTTIASQEFSGTYSVLNDEWLKYPHIVDQTFDIEKLHPELLNLAKETASELDSAFGEIKRDVQDIKELQDTINDWPVEQRDLFEKKLQKRLETLEAEITELVVLREDVAEKRKHYKALSEQEVRFKYLQKYFYMHVLTDLKTLLKQSPDLSMKDIPVVENIMSQANLKEASSRGNAWWLDPNGKAYPIETTHAEWVENNSLLLSKKWGLDLNQIVENNSLDYDGDTAETDWDSVARDATAELLAKGWSRIGDILGGKGYGVEVGDVHSIPSTLFDFLLNHKVGNTIIFEDGNTDVEISYEDLIKGQKAVNKALSQKRLQASKHEDSAEGRICIDFDQTIAIDKENGTIEKPEPNAKAAIDKLKADGWYIIIFSHRSSTEYGEDQIKEFLDKHDIPYDEIYTEKPNAEFFIDDRAITFTTWDEVLKKVETKHVPEKEASSSITSFDRSHPAFWIDPNGTKYQVKDTHEDWLFENEKMLRDQYGYGEDSIGQSWWDIKTINLLRQMLQDGWVRIGDLFGSGRKFLGNGVEIADLSHVPNSVFEYASNFGPGAYLMIEDLRHRWVEIEVSTLLEGKQEAVDYALKQQNAANRAVVTSALDLPIIDPTKFNRKEPYALFIGTQRYSKDVAVDLFDVFGEHPMITEHNRVPTVTLDTLVKENIPVIGKEPRAGDKQPFQDLSSVVKTAKLGSSYDYSSTHFLLPKELSEKIIRWAIETIPEEQIVHDEKDPGTKGIQLDSHITLKYGLHTNDFEDVKKALEGQKAPHIKFGTTSFFEPEGKDYDVVIIQVESDDLQKLNEKLCSQVEHDDLQFKEYHPHVTVAYVKRGKGVEFEEKDILSGEELDLSELIFSPKSGEKRTMELKGTNKESSFMPSNTDLAPSNDWISETGYPGNSEMDAPQNVSDEETWNSPENDRPRSKNFLKRMLSLFQNPLSKKEEPKDVVPVKEASSNIFEVRGARIYKNPTPEQAVNLWTNSTDHVLRYVGVGKDVYMWDAYNLDHFSFVEEMGLEDQWDKEGGIHSAEDAAKIAKDINEYYSAFTKTVKQASTNKEANYSHAYWLDPNGKIYPVRGDDEEAARRSLDRSNEDTHSAWILSHLDMLQKDYGIDPNSISGSSSDLVKLGWTRIGDAYGTDWGIDVSNINNIPSFVDDAIAQFAPEGAMITVAGPGSSRYSSSGFTFSWPVKSIQQTINSIKNRREYYQQQPVHAKQASGDDLIQFALADKQIRQHFKNRGTSVEDVISFLPNFSIKYIPKEIEKQNPSLASGTNGFYDFKTGTLYINPRLTLDNKRLTIIHEIEHAIQDASGVLPVHTEEDLSKVKRTPYMDRSFEWGARQQQFNALKARGMSLDDIVEFLVKRNLAMQKYDEYQLNYMRENVRNEVEQMEDIYNEMMPESIMASKQAFKQWTTPEEPTNNSNMDWHWADSIYQYVGENWQDLLSGWMNLDPKNYVKPVIAIEKIYEDAGTVTAWVHIEFVNTSGNTDAFMKLIISATIQGEESIEPEGREFSQHLTDWEIDVKDYGVSDELKKASSYGPTNYQGPSVADHDYQNSAWDGMNVTLSDEEDEKFLDQNGADGYPNRWMGRHRGPFYTDEGKVLKMLEDTTPQKQAEYRGNMDIWLAPDGQEYSTTRSHTAWIVDEVKLLQRDYGLALPAEGTPEDDNLIAWLISKGWVRVSGVLPVELDLFVFDINNIPQSAERFVWKYKPEVVIVEDLKGNDTSFDKEEYSKGLMKQAAISGQVVNTILQLIERSGGATYNLSKGNLVGTDAYAVAIYPNREQVVPEVDFDVLEGYITQNEDLLNDPNNSFGAWVSNGKTYLDVVATVVDKNEAMALGTQHNQPAIFSLKDMKEIPLQRVAKLAGVYSDKEQQKIYDKIYSERWPDDSAPIDGGNEYYDWSELGSNDYPNPQDLDKERALLDQLENPADRNMPTGLGEYAITYYDAMPAGNDDGGI